MYGHAVGLEGSPHEVLGHALWWVGEHRHVSMVVVGEGRRGPGSRSAFWAPDTIISVLRMEPAAGLYPIWVIRKCPTVRSWIGLPILCSTRLFCRHFPLTVFHLTVSETLSNLGRLALGLGSVSGSAQWRSFPVGDIKP